MNKLQFPHPAVGQKPVVIEAGVHVAALNYPQGMWLDPHQHREAQLVYAVSGNMQVTTPKGRWLVPPNRAVWVPGDLSHEIHMLSDVEMRTLYFDPDWLDREGHRGRLDQEFVSQVSPLFKHSILALFDGTDDLARAALLVRLIVRELRRADDFAFFMPLPEDQRCRRAAELVLAAPGKSHIITVLAAKVETSARTLSRLFTAETQLSFKAWCQRARIAAAVERLSTTPDVAVSQIASDLGYASIPAFSHAFRRVTGKSPTEFVTRIK
ncbi:MAG TPA: helix-turn-helix transcriptional regulator [Afipia sp.]